MNKVLFKGSFLRPLTLYKGRSLNKTLFKGRPILEKGLQRVGSQTTKSLNQILFKEFPPEQPLNKILFKVPALEQRDG